MYSIARERERDREAVSEERDPNKQTSQAQAMLCYATCTLYCLYLKQPETNGSRSYVTWRNGPSSEECAPRLGFPDSKWKVATLSGSLDVRPVK